jgi:hypothetical protein
LKQFTKFAKARRPSWQGSGGVATGLDYRFVVNLAYNANSGPNSSLEAAAREF